MAVAAIVSVLVLVKHRYSGHWARDPMTVRNRNLIAVTGPLDVIADHPIGALDKDLKAACLRALAMSRETCRNFALERSWENSARQFIGNLAILQPSRSQRPSPVVAGSSPVRS